MRFQSCVLRICGKKRAYILYILDNETPFNDCVAGVDTVLCIRGACEARTITWALQVQGKTPRL